MLDIVEKTSGSLLDRRFEIEDGVAHIVDLTVDELIEQSYDQTPDYDIITRIALDNNPYFTSTYKYFASENVVAILFRAPFMVILLGIIGTFAGFYLALGEGGDIKSGASVAIVSSLVGLPVSLLMDYINTLFPDKGRYQQAFDKYKVSPEMLFNHEKELNAIPASRGRFLIGPRLKFREQSISQHTRSRFLEGVSGSGRRGATGRLPSRQQDLPRGSHP